MIKTLLSALVVLLLMGGAFYGGRVYQNNADQQILTSFTPQNTGRTAFGGRGGGGGGAGGLVAAALAVGTPPADAGTGQSAAPAGGQGGAASGTGSQGGAAVSGGVTGPTGAGGRGTVTGQWVSADKTSLTVQGYQGQQSVPTTAATHYYQANVSTAAALAVGQRVSVAPDSANPGTASTVTIAPSGNLAVTVRFFGGGGGGGFGGGAGGASGGGGGFGGAGGATGARPRRAPGVAGTISALTSGSLTLRTAAGQTQAVKLAAATRVFQVEATTSDQYQAGSMVSVRQATINGQQVATDVVEATVQGAIVSLTTPLTSSGAAVVAQGASQ